MKKEKALQRLSNYINGEYVEPTSGRYLDNIEPATGEVYSLIPDSSADDLEKAIASAERAFPKWSALSLEERSKKLIQLAEAIEAASDQLARAEAIDNGKPVTFAKAVDSYRASANIRFFANACTQFSSESHSMGNEGINYTLRDPIGVVGTISPWNFPLYLFTWKVAPALAAGNTVIAKPSEITPMTAHIFAQLCSDVGIPKGVINILHGRGVEIGQAIVEHPRIKAISFTGGTATGKQLAATAAPMFKKLSLELGGKNPTLIFADCDFEKTVNHVVKSAFSNQGQICLCGSRIYIEDSIYEKFKAAFVRKVAELKVGDPLQTSTQQGALVSQSHMQKVIDYIELAKQEGGRLLTGGHRVELEGRCTDGFFVAPTVFEGLSLECRTNQEEIFGPVCTLESFKNDQHALDLANGTQYGLAASIWSQNVTRCHSLAKRLDFGIVWINSWLLRDLRTPFGGVKASGVGREGGLEAMRFFTEPKNVCIKY